MHVPNRYEVDTGICYGPASHWKGICDGEFGGMNGAMAATVAERDVAIIAENHDVLKGSETFLVRPTPAPSTPDALTNSIHILFKAVTFWTTQALHFCVFVSKGWRS